MWVGFYKKGSDKPSISWPEAVDEALCFGWIDGLRKGIDETSYKIRFTPRKTKSTWSTVNIKRIDQLSEMGRMQAGGLKVFRERDQQRTGHYSYEEKVRTLSPIYEKKFKANKKAWHFIQAQIPSYRKTVGSWVMSASKEETQLKRLNTLIDDSENGRIIPHLRRWLRPK